MYLYQRLLAEREEEERCRGRTSGRPEDTHSTVFPRKPVDASEDRSQDQRRNDLRRMRTYLAYGPKNRWEAVYLKHLKNKYPRNYLRLMGRAEKNKAEGHPRITYYRE